MKKTGKVLGAAALAVLLAFSAVSCDTGSGGGNNGIKEGPTHFYGTLTFGSGGQMWSYYRAWTRPSEAYRLFTEDREVIVFVTIFDSNNISVGEEEVGRGTIRGGILNFSVEELAEDMLFGWDALRKICFFYWEDAATDAGGIRGNQIMFRTTNNERLTLEIITGSRESLSQELVRFVYVDRPSIITGTAGSAGILEGGGGMTPTYFYTENDLNIYLQSGWNTLYRKQTFYTDERGDGRSGITLLLKNPLTFKWILYPEGYDGKDRDNEEEEGEEDE